MSSELVDEAKYLANRNDLLNLIRMIYKDSKVEDIVRDFKLVLVGGQALAVWHYNYFFENLSSKDIHYSFSDDIDFFGLKVSLEFLKSKLGVDIATPDLTDHTINLGVMEVESTQGFASKIIIDVIEIVGGLTKKEIGENTEIICIGEIEFPILNPVMCLKSRVSNFFSKYKQDKEKELYRVDIALRCCRSYLDEELNNGWSKDVSKHIENIFDLSLTREGCDIFVKHGIDFLEAINLNNPNLPESFIEKRFRQVSSQINTQRNKARSSIERFPHLHSKKKDRINLSSIDASFNVLSRDNSSYSRKEQKESLKKAATKKSINKNHQDDSHDINR